MRMFISWVAGFVALLVVGVSVGMLGSAVNVPPAIYFDTPVGYEVDGEYHEASSSPTSFGFATVLLSFVVAVWAGRAAYFRAWRAGLSPVGKLTLVAWLIAAIILVIAGALIDLALRSVHGSLKFYLRLVLEVAFAVGAGWSCAQWWKNRVARLPKE